MVGLHPVFLLFQELPDTGSYQVKLWNLDKGQANPAFNFPDTEILAPMAPCVDIVFIADK